MKWLFAGCVALGLTATVCCEADDLIIRGTDPSVAQGTGSVGVLAACLKGLMANARFKSAPILGSRWTNAPKPTPSTLDSSC